MTKEESRRDSIHLFVYGSLQPGGVNAHVLEPLGGDWQPAAVRGALMQAGWGAEMGYPGLILDESGELVTGYLLSSDALATAWPSLDEFEGNEYQRVSTMVALQSGESVEAFVYVIRAADPA
ncbi:MAG: gamma-glutamylcyclotransferase family protein [Pseudomonadota bacterium]